MVSRVPTALLGAFISITLIKAERQDLSLPSGGIKLNRDVEEVRTVEKQMKYYHRTKDEREEEGIGEVVRKKRELDRLVKREPSRRDDGRKEENKKKGVKNQETPLVKINSGLVVSSSQCEITIDLNYGDSAFLYSINDGTRVRRCKHTFQSPSGTKISLNCLQFNLDRSGCRKERMYILPGKNNEGRFMACTVESPSLMTPSNTLEIRYYRSIRVHSGGYVCTADVIGDPTNPTPTTCVPGKRLFCDDECGKATITVPTKIVGGEEATIAEYPWQVFIETYDGVWYYECGGSIIKKAWVLTAAHCFFDLITHKKIQITSIEVTFREHNFLQTAETIKIKDLDTDLYIHECYNIDVSNEHDIAIIYLGETLDFAPDIRPICMPTAQDFTAGQKVLVTGWGDTAHGGDEADTLQEVLLETLSMEECKTLNDKAPETYFFNENMICAYTKNKDTCKGDSGGPLITNSSDGRWVQLGIVSFGYKCAEPNVPGFYTNLAKYVTWITQITTTTDC